MIAMADEPIRIKLLLHLVFRDDGNVDHFLHDDDADALPYTYGISVLNPLPHRRVVAGVFVQTNVHHLERERWEEMLLGAVHACPAVSPFAQVPGASLKAPWVEWESTPDRASDELAMIEFFIHERTRLGQAGSAH